MGHIIPNGIARSALRRFGASHPLDPPNHPRYLLRMPAGRPTDYDPKYCEEVIPFLSEGYSITAFAGQIGVARSTVFRWANEHPEFSDAVKAGQAGAAFWWEKQNRRLATGEGDGNATSIIFGLKNRAREDWQDISRQEHTGADGKPIEVTEVAWNVVDPAKDS